MCIFSSLELNLWDYAWSTDIYMGIIATICSSIYFKNKIPSFILMIVTTIIFFNWFLMLLTYMILLPVEHPSIKGNYVFNKQLTTTEYQDVMQLRVTVYKEVFPLLYEFNYTATERFSKSEVETITLFKEGNYEVSEDGGLMSFGSFVVSLK